MHSALTPSAFLFMVLYDWSGGHEPSGQVSATLTLSSAYLYLLSWRILLVKEY